MKYKTELIHDILEARGHEKSSLHYESECVESWVNEAKGAYPKLCDYESEWLNYIKEQPIGEFPYETVTNVTDATINNVVPYAYKSAILKGQTLVNKLESGFGTKPIGISTATKAKYTLLTKLKEGKDYTISFDLEDVKGSDTLNVGFGWGWTEPITPSNGRHTIKFPKERVTTEPTFVAFYFHSGTTTANVKNVVVVEGSFDDIPYFEGMQSVKMPVLISTGKNLFDKSKLIGGEFTTFNGKNVYKYHDDGVNFNYNGKFENNTQYTLSMKVYRDDTSINKFTDILIYYSDGTTSSMATSHGHPLVFTSVAGKTVEKITGSFNHGENVYIDLDTVQIEKGTKATTYEPYKSNILTVNEEVELRGIGDVQDTLDCLSGEMTERICEIVFNGSENWVTDTVKTNTCVFKLIIKDMKGLQNHAICDHLPTAKDGDAEKIANGTKGSNGTTLYIALLKTKASNVNELKSYLSQNPITVQYLFETESIKTVDLSVVNQDGNTTRLRPIEGTMHISTSSETIKPLFSGEIPVEATTQNLASFIEEE